MTEDGDDVSDGLHFFEFVRDEEDGLSRRGE